jgi:hypothetical protein
MQGLGPALAAAFQWVTSPSKDAPRAATAPTPPAELRPPPPPAPPYALRAEAPPAERREAPPIEPPSLSREPRVAAGAVPTPRSIHIGAIEVQIHPAAPPPPRVQPSEAPRPAAAPAPLARGFTSAIGLRQG